MSGQRLSSQSMHEMREAVTRLIIGLMWINVLLAMTAAFLNEHASVAIISGIAVLLAVVPTAVWMQFGSATPTRIVTALCMAAIVSVIVAASASPDAATSYQIDMHMYFFAVLAILIGWFDIRPLLAFAAVVALHHLTFNFLLPELVFPGDGSIGRVALHAAILILETAALVLTCQKVNELFSTSEKAREDAVAAEERALALQASESERQSNEHEQSIRVQEHIAAFKAEADELVTELSNRAQTILQATEALTQLAHDSNSRADRAEHSSNVASGNVQTVSAAAEELSSSIGEIARQIAQTNEKINDANSSARAADETMNGLSDAANRIGEVITLIQAIAEQTNLLALNATIEAARAGEAGKGFAVVAAEVKDLATQTSKATEEISGQISEIQGQTRQAAEAIGNISARIDDVNSNASAISAAVSQQGEATNEISMNITSAAQGTQAVAENVQGLGEAVEQTSRAAGEVNNDTRVMEERIVQLGNRITQFLQDVA
ncbi:methyl-accepting chemotaxis protein [Pseudovibrio exalbescens]|uniref:methyl-accepting chemotaxis protein n=1 Tax=Pseudovibrio exalbescens TaxID=197461 RepID=UPI002366BC94|nr:methyl-accepting chemotaxis protein [Pseudovibrio exalbescens]MDD7909936.1 methyl-accepting chemotaxis protein [Pseudovibrio exalbescens]